MPRNKQATPSKLRQGLRSAALPSSPFATPSLVPTRKTIVQRSTPLSVRPQLARKRVMVPARSRESSSTQFSDHGSASVQREHQGRRRRRAPGILVMREIRRLQNSPTERLIPRAPFCRLIREVAAQLGKEVGFQSAALQAVQEASEFLLVSLFDDVNMAATHGRRVTIMPRDITLVLKLRRAIGRYLRRD